MDYAEIRLDQDDGIQCLVLNRPQALNAFTVRIADELIDAFGRASEDDSVRVVIVTGEGKAFCAGMDLGSNGNVFGLDERQAPTLADMEQCLDAPPHHPRRARHRRSPGFRHHCLQEAGYRGDQWCSGRYRRGDAAVDGHSAGRRPRPLRLLVRARGHHARGLFELAAARVVGVSQALELFYRADVFDAQEALRGGLLRALVPAADLRAEAERLARSFIGGRSAVSAALTRQMVYSGLGRAERDRAHRLESLGVFYTSQRDGKEGVAAFRERRELQFKSLPSNNMPPFYPW